MKLYRTRKTALRVVMALSLLVPSIIAQSDPVHANQKLEGFFRLSNQNCTDGKSDTCFFYFEVTGDAAKALYDNMRSVAEKDDCGGGTIKSDDERLLCFRFNPDDYACWFGYDLAQRTISIGDFAC